MRGKCRRCRPGAVPCLQDTERPHGRVDFPIHLSNRAGAQPRDGHAPWENRQVFSGREQRIRSGKSTRPQIESKIDEAPITFIGHSRLDTGAIRIDVDDRGSGSFQLCVDLQGALRDIIACEIRWLGSRYRSLAIEIDGLEGTEVRTEFSGRNGSTVSLASACETVGLDVDIRSSG